VHDTVAPLLCNPIVQHCSAHSALFSTVQHCSASARQMYCNLYTTLHYTCLDNPLAHLGRGTGAKGTWQRPQEKTMIGPRGSCDKRAQEKRKQTRNEEWTEVRGR